MKGFLFLTFLVVAYSHVIQFEKDDYLSYFKEWKKSFNKEYKELEEEEHRFNTWIKNWMKVKKHNLEFNLKKHTYRLGMNEYADLNATEFKRMNGYRNDMRLKTNYKTASTFLKLLNVPSLPNSVDWRKQGLVTPVKNQGQCGSCWAFSSTGSLEGQHMRKTGSLISLSEQNLVDCSTEEGNQGCEGGLMSQAFKYVKKQDGIDTESSYPYEAMDDSCRYKKSDRGADDTGYVALPEGDEDSLKQAAATIGPISVAIDASHQSFQLYESGVYNEPECSTSMLDHGVLVIGYGTTDDGHDYWLVKNSWGGSWGESGYIKMSRNLENQCGIATQPSYPTV